MILEGKSEDKKKVQEGKENDAEQDFPQREKEGPVSGADCGFFAFCHGGKSEGLSDLNRPVVYFMAVY